jgi:hypothetical protein
MDMVSGVIKLFMYLTGGIDSNIEHMSKCGTVNKVSDANELRRLLVAESMFKMEFPNTSCNEQLQQLADELGIDISLMPVLLFCGAETDTISADIPKFVTDLIKQFKQKDDVMTYINERTVLLDGIVNKRQNNIRLIMKWTVLNRIYSEPSFKDFVHMACGFCKKFANVSCSCGKVRYCCKEHQKLKWNAHKSTHLK